jgi:hypothetical protein
MTRMDWDALSEHEQDDLLRRKESGLLEVHALDMETCLVRETFDGLSAKDETSDGPDAA